MFGKLEYLSLEEFISEHRAVEALWMFMHIPKTAGSSFGYELSQVRPPYRNIYIDYEDNSTPTPQRMDKAIGNFIAETKTRRFRSCSGHFDVRQADAISAANPNTRLVTLLRDPVARVVSDYRYARTPAHPPYREFIEKFPTIDAYLDAPGQNKMLRFLAGNVRMPVPDAIELLDSRYAFIGTVEQYELSFNVIFQLLGVDSMPVVHQRRTEANEDNVVDLTPELAERIRTANSKDVAIYNHVRQRLLGKQREWLTMLGDRTSPVTGSPRPVGSPALLHASL